MNTLSIGDTTTIMRGVLRGHRGTIKAGAIDQRTGEQGWHMMMPPCALLSRKFLVFIPESMLGKRLGRAKKIST